MVNAQEWLNQQFPTPESKNQVKTLKLLLDKQNDAFLRHDFPNGTSLCIDPSAQGELNFASFPNLEKLVILKGNEKITACSLAGCARLTHFQFQNLANDNREAVKIIWGESKPLLKWIKIDSYHGQELDFSQVPNLTSLVVDRSHNLTTIKGLENCLNLTYLLINNSPKINLVDTFLDSWKREIEGLKTQLTEYEQPETTSDPQEALNTKIQRKKAELSQAITSGRKSTAPLRKEIELLERIQGLEMQINTLQAKETGYQQQIQQKEQTINQKQSQITTLQSQLTAKTTAEKQAQTKITQLEKQITDLHAEKTALQEKMLKERQEALSEWNQEKTNLTQQITQLHEQKDTFQKSADYLRSTLKGAEKTLEEVRKELALSQEKAQATAQEKDKLLEEKNEELRQRNEAFKVVSERNADLGNKLSLASSEISQLSEWISKLEAASSQGDAFVTLQKELAEAQSQIATLEEQLVAKQPQKNYLWLYALLALIALYFLMN